MSKLALTDSEGSELNLTFYEDGFETYVESRYGYVTLTREMAQKLVEFITTNLKIENQEVPANFEEVRSVLALKPGDIVRHKLSTESCIVTDNNSGSATAVRTVHISHANEWLILKPTT